jgi:hypothetical protein
MIDTWVDSDGDLAIEYDEEITYVSQKEITEAFEKAGYTVTIIKNNNFSDNQ